MLQLQQVEASSSDGEPPESAKTEDTESQLEEGTNLIVNQQHYLLRKNCSSELQNASQSVCTFISSSSVVFILSCAVYIL